MCGICGTAGFVDRDLLEGMTAALLHRGPDDGGVWFSHEAGIGLGNRRLAIIDLTPGGHQPMSNAAGDVWLTYNGETYNFPELRAELTARGYPFRSRSDTEVVLAGYETWGLDVLPRLNAMFALAIWDARRRRLVLARDRFGQKPLYYTMRGRELLFASEVKALLLDPRVPREVDPEALHRYLSFLWVPGPETMFRGIRKLPPGHHLVWEDGRVTVGPYWDLCFPPATRTNETDLAAELRAILGRAVARHLISDVPVGVLLSGGLDSSAILALAARAMGKPVTAYTIVFRPEDGRLEQSTEDAECARLVAREFGADQHEIVISPRIVDVLPKVIWHMDEPVADPAAINTYLISEAARPTRKVLLSGQGGDEVFAGYRVHWMHGLAERLAMIPGPVRRLARRALLARLPVWKSRIPGVRPGFVLAVHRYLDKLLDGVELPPEERYVFYRTMVSPSEQQGLYTPELAAALNGCRAGARHLAYFAAVPDVDFLNRVLYVDMKTFLPELNLTYSDKMTSAASIEMRVPLLDAELVDFMAAVPSGLKLRGARGSKYLFKKAMEGVLPSRVIHRGKAGFGAPIRAWLNGDLRGMVDDLLSDRAVRGRGLFEPAAVRRLIDDNRAGRRDTPFVLWSLLTLELWQRRFIDRPARAVRGTPPPVLVRGPA